MRTRSALGLGLCAAVFGTVLASAPAGAETVLTMNNYFPQRVSLFRVYMKGWADDVEKATNGRVKVHVPAATLGPSSGSWDMVSQGLADVVVLVNAFESQRLQLPKIAGIPYTADTELGAHVALWRTQEKLFAAANEYKGVKLLGVLMPAVYGIQSRERAIHTLDDLKGLKIRVGGGTAKEIADLLGATPVVFPGQKTFEAVANGIVDGTMMSYTAPVSLRYDRYIKFILDVPLTRAPMSFLMNADTWRKLSSEDRAIVAREAGEKRARLFGAALDAEAAGALKKLQSGKIDIEKPNPELRAAILKRLKPIEARWIAAAAKRGVDGEAALAFYRKTAEAVAAGRH